MDIYWGPSSRRQLLQTALERRHKRGLDGDDPWVSTFFGIQQYQHSGLLYFIIHCAPTPFLQLLTAKVNFRTTVYQITQFLSIVCFRIIYFMIELIWLFIYVMYIKYINDNMNNVGWPNFDIPNWFLFVPDSHESFQFNRIYNEKL